MVLRLLLATVFAAAGVAKLAAVEFEVRGFAHFGYAPWFMYLIGVIELGAGLLLLRPKLAPSGALVLAPVMIGAAVSHVRAGDGVAMAAPALLLLALLAGLAWMRRPDRLALPRGATPLPG